MDGFEGNSGVIVVAATNRSDILDNALLRPGRFDRRVTVGLPDVKGREQILNVHIRNKKLAEGITLNEIAKRVSAIGKEVQTWANNFTFLSCLMFFFKYFIFILVECFFNTENRKNLEAIPLKP